MIGLLAACGGAKDSYSYTDKVALSKKVMKSDSKAIKEYEEIMKKLSEKATKGDQDKDGWFTTDTGGRVQ